MSKPFDATLKDLIRAFPADWLAQLGVPITEPPEVLSAELARVNRLTMLYHGTVLPQASATVASALAAYQVGKVDFMTVLDNQMTLNRYHLEAIALAAERGTMLAELEMLTGRSWIDPDSVASDDAGGAQ